MDFFLNIHNEQVFTKLDGFFWGFVVFFKNLKMNVNIRKFQII